MNHQCRECQRLNPSEAEFCFFDGVPLDRGKRAGEAGSIDFSTWAFPMPFVFPSGVKCGTFRQLAQACQRNPQETVEVLQQGYLSGFFGSLGRVDLAMAAQAAAKAPDSERAVDDLLGKLPGAGLRPAQLTIEPSEIDLGVIQVGGGRDLELVLSNKGDRLLHGKVSIEACPWLVVGDSGVSEKLFQFFDTLTIPLHVRGKLLRAKNQPQKAEITVESNGGNLIVQVQVSVPVKPFTQGALAGATSPRQLAEKAKANTKEAALLLENGAVAQWYEANGWTYPVQEPTATGIAAVQQFFEVLGLVKPPKVSLSDSAISLNGKPGERLEYTLSLMTQEKRAAVAHAVSDQPWLTAGKTNFRGQTASISLIVEAVPSEPNRTLTATVKVTGNGNQRFDVPVTLRIGDGPAIHSPHRPTTPVSSGVTHTSSSPELPEVIPVLPLSSDPGPVSQGPPPLPVEPFDSASPATAPSAAPDASGRAARFGERKQMLMRLLPLGIVLVGLLTALAHDIFFSEKGEGPLPDADYANPLLALRFHEAPGPIVKTAPTMRFGLRAPDPKDPSKIKGRLILDDFGQTCNVCVRIDTSEFLWGVEQGEWKPMKQLLGKDPKGKELAGARCVWMRTKAPLIHITQHVEIVPGGLSEDGKKRFLDTCLVYYTIVNEDTAPHDVGLRFLLDTFIGNTDAEPFIIAGAKKLCDTMETFDKPADVPDYIAALERQDVKNPGTVAHLTLRYGGVEPPSSVILGAWPDASLRKPPALEKNANMEDTRWDVPKVKMELAKHEQHPKGDSAVTMYWDKKPLQPKASRTVGFAYGLGTIASDKDGQLGMTAGGELAAGKEFTLTAFVKNPTAGTPITLKLPSGLELAGGKEKDTVLPPGPLSPYSPVTWRVKALRGGVHRVKVQLGSGPPLEHLVGVRHTTEDFK